MHDPRNATLPWIQGQKLDSWWFSCSHVQYSPSPLTNPWKQERYNTTQVLRVWRRRRLKEERSCVLARGWNAWNTLHDRDSWSACCVEGGGLGWRTCTQGDQIWPAKAPWIGDQPQTRKTLYASSARERCSDQSNEIHGIAINCWALESQASACMLAGHDIHNTDRNPPNNTQPNLTINRRNFLLWVR